MDVNSGEVLSLVSLPDYNVNIRNNISDIESDIQSKVPAGSGLS